jgi:hypothetical protein
MTKVRRYRLTYWGTFIGSYDTAKKALEAYRKYEEIRPIIDRKGRGRFSIRDQNKEITLADLKRAVDKE